MSLIFKKSSAQPEFTVGAAITGTVQVGETLTCTYTVTKARASNVTVRWYSYFDAEGTDQVLIGTGTTYVLTGNELGRYIRTIVTASNPAGTVQSTSSYTAAVTTEVPPDPPTITSAAAITGTLEVGQTLTVSVTFSGATSTTYQWYSYTSPGKSNPREMGTGTTQVIPAEDDGRYIGCEATGTNASGTTVSAAAVVGPVTSPATSAPTIVNAAVVSLDTAAAGYNEGEYVICDVEFSGHTSTPTFAWYKCDAGRANPELITGALSPIRPLPVSEPNQWRSALFLDQSLGLNAANKYIYCVASGTNSEGTTPSESNAEGPIGGIQGTAITQAMVGDGPYYLSADGGTYYLSENISTKGTAFVIRRANIKLNLNGKTVTFDNESLKLANGGFESGTTGWDFTNAPNASIYESANFTSDYNNRRLIDGTKSLLFNNTACADAGVQQWVSTGTITLESNKYYGLSFMAYAGGANPAVPFIRLRHATSGVVLTGTIANSPKQYDRGMAYVERVIKVTHDPPEYTVEVGVTGTAGATGTAYIDDVRIARTRCAGVAANPQAYRYTSIADAFTPTLNTVVLDIASYTSGSGGWVVKNGTINQGTGGGQWATTVWYDQASGTVARITAAVDGPNSSAVRRVQTASAAMTIIDNTFTGNHVVCGWRDYYWGAGILHGSGTIARNRFFNWTTSCISPSAGNIVVYGNEFYPKMRWTNGFAINLYALSGAPTAAVYDNLVDASGDYYGAGIASQRNFNSDIYNNDVKCQTPSLNQEYGPNGDYTDFGIYAMQVENVTTGTAVSVFGNTVEAIAAGGTSDTIRRYPRATAFRCSNFYASPGTVNFFANSITATASGYGRATAFGISNLAEPLQVGANTVSTNSTLLRIDKAIGLRVGGLSVDVRSQGASKQHVWEIAYSDTYPHFGVTFADTTYSTGSQSIVESALPINYVNNTAGSNFASAAGGNIALGYTITFTGAAADTAIVIKDKDGNTVSSGTTNAFGEYAAIVPYQRVAGTTITNLNDHTVTVGVGSPVTFTSDATKAVSLA